MSILGPSWKPVVGQLSPGVRYRASYRVICANETSTADLARALNETGIEMLPSFSFLEGAFGATDEFRVKQRMSLSEFAGKLSYAFELASKTAWVSCGTPSVLSIEEVDASSGAGGVGDALKGVGIGLILAVVFAGVAVYYLGRND